MILNIKNGYYEKIFLFRRKFVLKTDITRTFLPCRDIFGRDCRVR